MPASLPCSRPGLPALFMTSCGSPSHSLRPNWMTVMRSTTARSACTMCSIQTMVTPVARSLLDLLDELLHLGLGEAAGDLVQEQQLGVGGQSPGQFEALAVEQGERTGQDVDLLVQAGDLQDVHAVLVGGPLRHVAAVGGAHQDVLEHGHARERLGDLERAADARAAALVPGEVGDVLAVEDHLAGVGMHGAGDEVEPGGLARPVGTDDTERLTFIDADAQIVDHQDPSERLSKALGFKSYRQVDPPPCVIPVPLPSLCVCTSQGPSRNGPSMQSHRMSHDAAQVKKNWPRTAPIRPLRQRAAARSPRGSPEQSRALSADALLDVALAPCPAPGCSRSWQPRCCTMVSSNGYFVPLRH